MAITVLDLSMEMALDISVLSNKLAKYTPDVARQIYRSATSVSANISEAKYAESDADFVHKLEIAQKECFETEMWLTHLYNAGFLKEETFKPLRNKCGKIRRMLIASITKVKRRLK